MNDNDNPPGPGHNQDNRLKAFAERLNRLMDEKAATAEDIKELNKEVKSAGYTPKILAQAVKQSRLDAKALARQSREESELKLYQNALQAWSTTPLGQAGGGA
jgi:uncharacterized protein (UPF0335 family)